MLTVFPVEDLVELLEAAEEKWYECTEADWRQHLFFPLQAQSIHHFLRHIKQ